MSRRSRLALAAGFALLAGFQGSAKPAAPLGFIGALLWTYGSADFGGLSAVEMSSNGRSLFAVSDQAQFVRAELVRNGSDEIMSAKVLSLTPLLDTAAAPLVRPWTDSEGLALAVDGSFYISFEGRARVWHYASADAPPEPLPNDPAFGLLGLNAAFEALAIDDAGTLYTLPEASDGPDVPFTLFRFQNGVWDSALTLPRRGSYLPVGADFGPDGRLYLLERAFYFPIGFSSRLRRFEIMKSGLANETALFETPVGLHDNLEGLSIWRDGLGHLRATMISDDNFLAVLKTELVEYRLPD